MRDSFTDFDASEFVSGAAGIAGLLGTAVAIGVANARRDNGDDARRADWAAWNRRQLESALELSELLRQHAIDERDEARRQLARYKIAQRKIIGRSAMR